MKSRVERKTLSTKLNEYSVSLKMSEQSLYDLAYQKQMLIKEQQDMYKNEREHIEGLINMLDDIQDQIAEIRNTKGESDEVVFPFSDEAPYEIEEPIL